VKKVIQFFQTRGWLIGGLAVILALVWPVFFSWLDAYIIYLLMGLILVRLIDIGYRRVIWQRGDWVRKVVLFGLFFLLPPALIWLIGDYLPRDVFLGLMLASMMPAGLMVSDKVRLWGGSESKAKVMILLTHILAPVAVVVLGYLFLGGFPVRTGDLVFDLIKIIGLPLAVASVIRSLKIGSKSIGYLPVVGELIYFCLILAVISPVRDNILFNWDKVLLLVLLVIVLVLISALVGFFIGSSRKDGIVFSWLMADKNLILGVWLAGHYLGSDARVAVTVYFLVVFFAELAVTVWGYFRRS